MVKSLSGDMALRIAELAAARHHRLGGAPRPVRESAGRHWDPVPWSDLSDGDELSGTKLARFMRGLDPSRLLLVCSDTAASPPGRLAK